MHGHSRSPGGDQEVLGQELWTSEGTGKHDCKLTWIIQADLNNEECPLAQKVNKSLAHWTKTANPPLRPGAASGLGFVSAWREGQDAPVLQALPSSLLPSKELMASPSPPPCLQVPAPSCSTTASLYPFITSPNHALPTGRPVPEQEGLDGRKFFRLIVYCFFC